MIIAAQMNLIIPEVLSPSTKVAVEALILLFLCHCIIH